MKYFVVLLILIKMTVYNNGTNHYDLGLSKAGNEGHYINTYILTGVTHHFYSSCQQEKDVDGWEVDRSHKEQQSHLHTDNSFFLKSG